MQHNVFQIVEKLLEERQIRAELVVQGGHVLRFCRDAQYQLSRGSRRQIHDGINQKDSAKQDGDR